MVNVPQSEQQGESKSTDVAEDEGLLFACRLDGTGGAKLTDWSDVETWSAESGPIWIHLDSSSNRVKTWVRERSGLTPVTADAILNEETRPRVFQGKRGFIAILRGVNTNPDANPEDMVAMRLWCDGTRLITVRYQKLLTPRDVLEQLLEHSTGPVTVAQLFERLISRLTERMATIITGYDDVLDSVEEQVELGQTASLRGKLGDLRRQAVVLRRYMAPQREALGRLLHDPPQWLDERSLLNLREATDRLQRYIEDLDAARERAVVVKDEISNRLSESMNRNMYVISVVAAIFLPLGFLTGLLGINVGGMPGVESPMAFWITCFLMVLVLIAEVLIFRKLKWF